MYIIFGKWNWRNPYGSGLKLENSWTKITRPAILESVFTYAITFDIKIYLPWATESFIIVSIELTELVLNKMNLLTHDRIKFFEKLDIALFECKSLHRIEAIALQS